ncbi:MAG TPA: DUF3592 domain-containing protein [Candidatus Sulfotelmatobacter sp.]|nr:DUF3592 domain-containing protein [Candidatus Sulfotelmatobacter sp.]
MRILTYILLTAMLTAMVWIIDVPALHVLLLQHRAESFPHVQGTVLYSQVTKTIGSKGHVQYHPLIGYRYTVGDQDYRWACYRYDGHCYPSGSAWQIVESHPPGSTVDVYYNPKNPADALLSPTVDKPDVAIIFFGNALILVLVAVVWTTFSRASIACKMAGGVRIITEMMVTRLRLPRYQPSSIALLATAILSLLAAAAIAFGLLSPPWIAGEWLLPIVLIGGAAVYAWQYMDVQSGKRDLVIDESSRTVQLPLTFGRREQTPVSFSQIRAVLSNKVRHRTKNGVYYTYMVTLEMTDSTQQKLIDLSLKRAQSLTIWLVEKFGVPEKTVELDGFESGQSDETAKL